MRVGLLLVLLLGACDGSALPALEADEHPAELAGTWVQERLGHPDPTSYALHPDGRAEKLWLDKDGSVEWSEPGTWRVTGDELVVATEWTTLTSRYRLDGDVLSLGLFEQLAATTGIATFQADVLGWHPVPKPNVISYLLPGAYVSHQVSLTIEANYTTSGYRRTDDHSDCIIIEALSRGRCELDDTGELACTIAPTSSSPYTVRAPIDPETGLPRLEGVPSGYLAWRRTAS